MSVVPWDDPKRVWLNIFSVAIGAMANETLEDRDLVREATKIADASLDAYVKRWPKEGTGHDDG